jgi:superfamily I DNA and RNA helicase
MMEATWWTQPEQLYAFRKIALIMNRVPMRILAKHDQSIQPESVLDVDQLKVLGLPKEGDFLVIGPPGSGKTNILILRAAFLHKAKLKNIFILTFGRVLREFLATGVKNYPFAADKIQTYVRWGTSLLRENNIDFEEKGKIEEVRARLLEELLLLGKKNDPSNIFDCILIDEVQDYTAEEIEAIRPFAEGVPRERWILTSLWKTAWPNSSSCPSGFERRMIRFPPRRI